jgi:hypothetical protein
MLATGVASLYPVSRTTRRISLAISALVLASAVVGAALALVAPLISTQPHSSWVLASFEVVTIAAAATGVLFGLGHFREAPGLALACVAGTILVSSTLGWAGSAKVFLGHSLTPYLLGRALASVALALLGAACVLGRDPRAWRWAVTGAVLAAPALLVGAAALTSTGSRYLGVALGASPIQRTTVVVLGGLVLGSLLAAGGHMLIRAFELGRTDEQRRLTSPPAA